MFFLIFIYPPRTPQNVTHRAQNIRYTNKNLQRVRVKEGSRPVRLVMRPLLVRTVGPP